jgi:alpha-ketoglutarate-dependent taurine dioxygenase
MRSSEIIGSNLKTPGGVKRRAIDLSRQEFAHTETLPPGASLPLIIKPAVHGASLLAWASNRREFIHAKLMEHGAILFRGFFDSISEFELFIRTVSGDLAPYQDRSSPRHPVSGNIYTSTDHPADQRIPLHNENSYSSAFPMKLFFACVTPAERGGETPIADGRKILGRIAPAIRERFIEKQVMYVRNFGDGFGLGWRSVFQTDDKAAVEEYCRANDIKAEWKSGDRLRTIQTRPAVARHPRTGDEVWFNHAVFFHVSTLEPVIREALLSDFSEEDLPTNVYYGDGAPIEASTLDELRAAYAAETVAFAWEAGDCLMVENMLAAHGREPFAGNRKIIVGMTEPITRREIQSY